MSSQHQHAATAADLIAWAGEDAALRAHLVESRALHAGGYHPQMRELHERNADRLAEVIDRIGWPSAAAVGPRAAEAAWLIAQHAIGRPAFFCRCAALVSEAAARGETPAWQAAMMIDRIRVFEGRPQIYGTQFDWDAEGRLSPLPIEDPDGVDDRRRGAGLNTLAERRAELRERAARESDGPPADAAERRAEAERWAKSVGWRS